MGEDEALPLAKLRLAYDVGKLKLDYKAPSTAKLQLSYREGQLDLAYREAASQQAEATAKNEAPVSPASPSKEKKRVQLQEDVEQMEDLLEAPGLQDVLTPPGVEAAGIQDLLAPPGAEAFAPPAASSSTSAAVAPAAAPPSTEQKASSPSSKQKKEKARVVIEEPEIVEAKREPAMMQPEPLSPGSSKPSAQDSKSKVPQNVATPQSLSSPSSRSKEEEKSTAPASPADTSPPKQASRGNSGGEAPWSSWGATRRSPANQTSAYQALSTNECNPTGLAANSGVTESSAETLTATVGGTRAYPPPAPLHMVGSQRKRLREQFNLKEIDVEMIFHRYDTDRSNQLEQKELRLLLQDFIGRRTRTVTDSEYSFVMAVADKNHDDCISKKEIVYGLQAWYAFNFMPIEVNAALKKYRISPDGQRMPPPDVIRSLLTDLNGFIEVDAEHCADVRRTAKEIGASEEKVTLEQLRRAIAVWYLNIERGETTPRLVMEHSFSKLSNTVLNYIARFLQTFPEASGLADLELGGVSQTRSQQVGAQGEPLLSQASSRSAIVDKEYDDLCCGLVLAPLALWLIAWILPGLYMVHVGGWYPTPSACEHDLASLIQFKGFLCMTIGFCGLLYRVVRDGQFRKMLMGGGFVAALIFLIQDIVGFGLVLSSNPEKCGAYLLSANQFFFVWSCLWFPCLWCCCGACCLGVNFLSHYVTHARHDGNLRLAEGPRQPPSTRE